MCACLRSFLYNQSASAPEIVEIAKRIALLPKDAVRVINGISHLPIDTMRAIAVLDAPAEVTNETANETVEGEEAGVIPYGAELEAENGDVVEEQPEEPAPQPTPPEGTATNVTAAGNNTTATTPAPVENISGAHEALEEIPKYESLEDVYEEGEKYFQNATTGLLGLSNELDIMNYSMDRIKDLYQMGADIRENLVYTDFLQGYGAPARNFEEDLKNYSAARIELDKKYDRYMTNDGSLNETESNDLWNDVWRLEGMNSEIRTHISGGINSTKLWWGSSRISPFPSPSVPMFDPQGTEAAKKLFGEDISLRTDRPDDGLIDGIYYNLKDDHDILSQAQQEIENRQRELGVRQ